MKKDWLYIKGACRMVSFEKTFQNVFSEYSFALEVRLEMERRLVCVRLKHIKKLQGLQLKANVSLRSPHKGKR